MVTDDRCLDYNLVKLPETFKDMIVALVQKSPAQANNLIITNIVTGHYSTRIFKTPKLEFTTSLYTIAVDFIPLLEATWKGKEAMENKVKCLNKRKTKSIEIS